MKEIQKKLITIQCELDAPKGQTNSFGNYKFRSCEDILAALKPLLKKTETTLLLNDEIIMIGTRIYVKATASINSDEESISVSAFARETETKKGMDESQITGSASSYARKYALNGLFCIDDTKDADNHDNREPVKKTFPGKQRTNNPDPKPMSPAVLNCTACGKECSKSIAEYSVQYHRKILCFDCQKKAKEDKEGMKT